MLRAPPGDATRPTSEKVREALFSILGPPREGDRVLDLFAGSGGLGLEALSRGAAHATFVDSARNALDAVRHNVKTFGMAARSTIVPGDAVRLVATLRPPPLATDAEASAAWRWIFIDPPYASDLAVRAASAIPAVVMDAATAVVIEHDRRNAPPEQLGSLLRTDLRRYGDTLISLYRLRLEQP